MEEKKVKIMLVQSGNGSENYRLRIPTPWIKQMELDEERNVTISFDGNKITIVKEETAMTKNEIARNITGTEEVITRVIASNYELDFTENSIYDNLGKAESWSVDGEFKMENNYGQYIYLLKAYNVPVHHVDYSNEKELEALGATGCEKEKEVLVAAETALS